jgi:hypothetical protein
MGTRGMQRWGFRRKEEEERTKWSILRAVSFVHTTGCAIAGEGQVALS